MAFNSAVRGRIGSTPMNTRLLHDETFHATFAEPMRSAEGDEGPPCVDIWPYIEAIPGDDLISFSVRGQDVECVWRTGDGRYDHVLIPTHTKNVYLVIVVDLEETRIFGHHVINLNEKYGLPTPGIDD